MSFYNTPSNLLIFEDSQTETPHPFRDILEIFPVQQLNAKKYVIKVIGTCEVHFQIDRMAHALMEWNEIAAC